jgi:hypothetical protein
MLLQLGTADHADSMRIHAGHVNNVQLQNRVCHVPYRKSPWIS